MPVRNMPSNVPAPPIDATGAPSPWIFPRLRMSAPRRVPMLSRDICEGSGELPRKQEAHRGRDQRRCKDRLGYADALYRVGHQVYHHGHNGDTDESGEEEPVLRKEVKGEQNGDNGAAEVDRDDCAGPVRDVRNHITHAPQGDNLVRHHVLSRQVIDGDIHIASEEREKEKGKHMPAPDAHPFVGVPQDADLNRDDQDHEEDGEEEQEWEGNREIVMFSLPV